MLLPSSSCLPSSGYPLSLCLGISFSFRLIVLVEVACVENVGSLRKVSFVREGRDSASRHCRKALELEAVNIRHNAWWVDVGSEKYLTPSSR